jgi:hypothetical protein
MSGTARDHQQLAMEHTAEDLGSSVQAIREALEGHPSVSPSINVLLAYIDHLELRVEQGRTAEDLERLVVASTPEGLVEALAAAEHDGWAHWMRYLFSRCHDRPEGGLIIPQELVERWRRQMETPYAQLTDREQESDRQEVRKILPIIELYAAAQQIAITSHIVRATAGGRGVGP